MRSNNNHPIVNKATLSSGLVVTCCLLLAGCLLVKEDEYIVEVPQVPDFIWNEITISYTGTPQSYIRLQDTVYLDDKVHVKIDPTTLLEFKASLNDVVVSDFGWSENEFQLLRNSLPAGLHVLKIIQHVKSGTKSLADKVGAEYVELEGTFIVKAGPNEATPVISSIALSGGTLKINWSKYTRDDFKSYEIIKATNLPYPIFVITDQSATSFSDITYAAGNQDYFLQINTAGKSWKSASKNINYHFTPKFELEKLGTGQTRLRVLEKPLTANNIVSYSIGGAATVSNIPAAGFEYVDLAGTINFGETKSYFLSFRAASPGAGFNFGTHGYATSQVSVALGKKTTPFEQIIYDKTRNVFFLNKNGQTVFRMDATSYALVDSLQLETTASSSASLVMSQDGNYLLFMRGKSIKRLNPVPLSHASSFSLTDFGIASAATLSSPVIDNFDVNNKGQVILKISSTNHMYVVDLATRTQVDDLSSGLEVPTQISIDGGYHLNGNKLSKATATNFALPVTLPYTSVVYARFLRSHPNYLVMFTGTSIVVYDCAASSVVRTIAQTASTQVFTAQPHIDFSTNMLLLRTTTAFSANQYAVIDLLNSATPVKQVSLYSQTYYSLEGNRLFAKSGRVTTDF